MIDISQIKRIDELSRLEINVAANINLLQRLLNDLEKAQQIVVDGNLLGVKMLEVD